MLKNIILNNERAFSLMEVIISLGVIGIVLGGMAPVFANQVRLIKQTEILNEAALAGQKVIDDLRSQDILSLPTSGSNTTTITVGKRTYEVTTSFCNRESYCDSGSRDISVNVNYNEKTFYTIETVFAALI